MDEMDALDRYFPVFMMVAFTALLAMPFVFIALAVAGVIGK